MSQMPQSAAGSTCPNPACEEPVESGDRFCGGCGYDLSTVWAAVGDRPTLPVNGARGDRTGTTRQAPRGSGPAGLARPGAAHPGAPEHGAGAPGAGAPGAFVEWPAAPGTDGSELPAPVHLPTDLPGTDSGGGALPTHTEDAVGPADPATGERRPTPPAAAPEGPGTAPGPAAGPSAPPAPPAPPQQPPSFPAAGAAAAPVPPGAPAPASAPNAAPAPQPAAAEPEDYELAAPRPPAGTVLRDDPPGSGAPADPRTVVPGALPAPAPEARLCVFCATGRVDRDDYCENCGKAQPRERDHVEQELGAVAAVSDRGHRHHRNEDAFAVSSTALQDGAPAVLAIVCDGVSSASRPDDASSAASRAATESLLAALPRGTHPQQAMHEAILAASKAVNALAGEPGAVHAQGPNHNAPACTLVGAIIAKDLLVVGWVGDSRAYWVPVDRSAPAARLTEDDSWAAQMVATGLMNEAEAYADERAHAITGWLGADAYELEPHTAAFKPDRPGVVVVCTDGLWNYAEGAGDMASILPPDAAQRPLHSARVLVGHALDGGGHDNVTVAVLPFPAPPPGAGSA
ncbi:hypothetical protein GCM10018793_61990 [Streptomyces sulfonofaciens]|uniref:PPM-type phosphatase domain-containing protein n=1 Tax=Streptomyces sulfonofaciens TaxID=68272 RepID=A0A919GM01_9ACTN|nr:PP2C family serine/threonine-protein phosphatase [Streptomyces sulfonofaciens]GHH87169.1 hypothetical protein GCM10018793_61990 [Streptomyces sulfonofaciens]